MEKFNREDLEFYLRPFKGLSKEYILDCIFNESIQSTWVPTTGDVIVGPTGNVFVISNTEFMHLKLGGTRYYFGGSMCSRNGSNFVTETSCYTMNESGKWITWGESGLEEQDNPYHSSWKKFRFVPYPHEIERGAPKFKVKGFWNVPVEIKKDLDIKIKDLDNDLSVYKVLNNWRELVHGNLERHCENCGEPSEGKQFCSPYCQDSSNNPS